MSGPNWCEPCGRYHPRDYAGCEGRKQPAALPVLVIDSASIDVPDDIRITEAAAPGYVNGWQAGYAACLKDITERRAAS